MARTPRLEVLHEDDHLIAFAKPAGLLVVPDRWDHGRIDLMSLVHAQFSPSWYNVHRLDRDTSGVLLCAKTAAALRALSEQFESGQVEKRYLALVKPAPVTDSGTIDVPLAPESRRAGRMHASTRGKTAVTRFVVQERWRHGFALVEASPLTGRQHQVRVHLAHLGSPVVADPLYGDGRPLRLSELKAGYKGDRREERPLLARQALHAHRLTIIHPASAQPLAIAAPLPIDLAVALDSLRRHAR